MISSNSIFYYGYQITENNFYLDFKEGSGPELSAEIELGFYTPTTFCQAIKAALDTAGALTYTVTFNRSNRKITISSTSAFSLLNTTGTHVNSSAYSLAGFGTGSYAAASTYTGAQVSGDSYEPQFKLQDYVSKSDYQEAVDATVNESASGRIEVVKFGTREFYEFNIMFATDIAQTSGVITNDSAGVSNLRRFMQYLVKKAPFEFMPDKSSFNTYDTLILENTEENSKGVGYRLKEMYDRNLPGYYQTGRLKFRVVEV